MTIETKSDLGPGKAGKVRYWLDELHLAREWQDYWQRRAARVLSRYEGKTQRGSSSFNILHSNTETLRAAMYGGRPKPDIRRRGKLPNNADRAAAEILERAVEYMNDTAPYDNEVEAFITDLLLTGRGVLRVRYVPTIIRRREPVTRLDVDDTARFFTANNNEVDPGDVVEQGGMAFVEFESVEFERADVERVHWRDYLHNPARTKREIRWMAFRHEFTRSELREAFGKAKADRTSLTCGGGNPRARGANEDPHQQPPDMFTKAEVWEIWDSSERKIVFISPGNADEPLLEVDDGPDYYNLRDFFPTPGPLLSVATSTDLEPIPEFTLYQDLANELDDITERIEKIVQQIKVRGVYDGSATELAQVMELENELIPVDSWRALSEKGGIENLMGFVPIDAQIEALQVLYQQRAILLDTIYQVIGLADIMRGQSDPRETATAQNRKSQFGQLRLAPRQRQVAMYLRDLLRIQVELIAEKFEPEVISVMAGIPVDENAVDLMRNDALRNFAIDIETDSTAPLDDAERQRRISDLLEAIGAYGNAAQALPEQVRLPVLQSVLRRFRLGREVEIALEEAAEQPQQPDPEAMAAAAEAQTKRDELRLKAVEADQEYQLGVAEEQRKRAELALERERAEAEVIRSLGDA